MPLFKDSRPSTPRDHEIVALVNAIIKVLAYYNHAVIFAALAQVFLYVLSKDKGDDLPVEMNIAAAALSEVCKRVRELPQDVR